VRSARIEVEGPVDVPGSFERFTRWGDDPLDHWDQRTLTRTAVLPDGSATTVAITPAGTVQAPVLDVSSPRIAEVEPLVSRMILTEHRELRRLASEDRAIGAIVEAAPPRRPVLSLDPFAHLIASITSQQINLKWAVTLRARLVEAYGTPVGDAGVALRRLEPERLAEADPAALREMQFSGRKAEYIVGLAQAVSSGELSPAELEKCDDEEVMARLTALRGIGRWTAEWYLARVLGRPHVVAGDLAVRKVIGRLYLDGDMPSEQQARELTSHWGGAAVVAQQLALEHLYS
jgi:DNA-3-methyladenine glycosylase II